MHIIMHNAFKCVLVCTGQDVDLFKSWAIWHPHDIHYMLILGHAEDMFPNPCFIVSRIATMEIRVCMCTLSHIETNMKQIMSTPNDYRLL